MKKIAYGFVQLTGGFLMTYIGLIVSLFILLFMRKKAHFHKNGYSGIIEIGGNGGGLEFGAIALCGSYSQKDGPCYSPNGYEHTRRHEFGHTIQNLIFGPFYLFVVGIPSAIRYWYKRIMQKKGKRFSSDGYDSIGFEGTATRGGTKAIDKIENKKTS